MKLLISFIIIIILIFAFLLIFGLFTLQENFGVNSNLDVKVKNALPQLYDVDTVRKLYRYNRIYPLNGTYYYDVADYPNVVLPGEVVGCGGRRGPCYGGSQQSIANLLPPLDISNNNIAPNYGSIGPKPSFIQVGYLYKIFGQYKNNYYKPLYLEKVKEKNGYYIYNYFTIDNDEKRKVFTPSKYRKLGTNDQVTIDGEKYFYRVSINEDNFPTYPRIKETMI